METRRRLLPLPRSGRVVRALVEGKRRGSQDDVFLVALEGTPAEDLAWRYLGEGAEVIDEVEFSLSPDRYGAILYVRPLDAPGAVERARSLLVVGGVPERATAEYAPMSKQEFLGLVHEPHRLALEVGAREVARRIAEAIPVGRAPALWALQDSFVEQLDPRFADAMKGTDSYLYWALAVLYGNRNPFDDAADLRMSFSDAELDSAEDFCSLASDVHFIQTGHGVVFDRDLVRGFLGSEPHEAISNGLAHTADGRLFGFYFIAHDSTGADFECAGFLAGVDTFPVRDTQSLDLRVRDLAAQSGLSVDGIYVSDTGFGNPYDGGAIITLTTRK